MAEAERHRTVEHAKTKRNMLTMLHGECERREQIGGEVPSKARWNELPILVAALLIALRVPSSA
eukprot:514406-Rhodomonas_salina.2